jgi:hypothetical protein
MDSNVFFASAWYSAAVVGVSHPSSSNLPPGAGEPLENHDMLAGVWCAAPGDILKCQSCASLCKV